MLQDLVISTQAKPLKSIKKALSNMPMQPAKIWCPWTIQINFFLHQNKTFHFSMSHAWYLSAKFNWDVLWCGSVKSFILFKAFLSEMSSYCSWAALCSHRGLNLVWSAGVLPDNNPVKSSCSMHTKFSWDDYLKFSFCIPQGLKKSATAVLLHPISPTMTC